MEKLIGEYLKEHGFKEFKWAEPLLVVFLKNGKRILIFFNMMLVNFSILSKADCVKMVLDERLKGISYDGAEKIEEHK